MQNFFHVDASSPLKTKVLTSALYLFVEKGYFNTSIPDLVKHSGVSTGTIYKHFGDKQGLANSLMERLIEELYQQEIAIIEPHSSAQARYRALVVWMMQFSLDYPEVMSFILYARHKDYLPNSSHICSSKPFMILRDIVQQGIDSQELRKMDGMVAASLAFGGVLRMVQLHLDGLLERPLMAYLDELTDSAWRAIENPTKLNVKK
ncbi:MAG: TetR/AcrR family transcriptional regulator [Thiomicrospira sp.]|uniref:TetR/AcrR family transcriptional regulator n=1 Tax=Thiomicrospira sp. TaxID=935 RepID=UPI0019FD0266|nr:TetR/AcrR family transcriptional regulator [Thiomicrospira sp.]MBE0492808.1 TetR/AcrR family transcriptional regulator [Thiomicrospira sp.]